MANPMWCDCGDYEIADHMADECPTASGDEARPPRVGSQAGHLNPTPK